MSRNAHKPVIGSKVRICGPADTSDEVHMRYVERLRKSLPNGAKVIGIWDRTGLAMIADMSLPGPDWVVDITWLELQE